MKNKIVVIILGLSIILGITLKLAHNKSLLNAAKASQHQSDFPVSVSVLKLDSQLWNPQIHLAAMLKPEAEASIYAQVPGLIQNLNLELGDTLHTGQRVGSLDTRLLRISLQSAILAGAKLRDDYHRSSAMWQGKATTEANYLSAKYAWENNELTIKQIQQQIANAQLIAPIHGIVISKNFQTGEYINPGNPLATLVDIHHLKASVYLDEQGIRQIHLGQKAKVSLDIDPLEQHWGKIIFINPKADENHNYQADVLIDNQGRNPLKAGNHVWIDLNSSHPYRALLIPKIALIQDRQKPSVFVVQNNQAILRPLVLGPEQGDLILVLQGLQGGDQLITSGQINLVSGSKISIVHP